MNNRIPVKGPSIIFTFISKYNILTENRKLLTYQQALPMPWNLEMPSAENSLNSGFSLVKARIKSSLDRTKALFCSILFIVTKPWIERYINLIHVLKEVKESMKFNINGKAHLRANMLNHEITKCVNSILSL